MSHTRNSIRKKRYRNSKTCNGLVMINVIVWMHAKATFSYRPPVTLENVCVTVWLVRFESPIKNQASFANWASIPTRITKNDQWTSANQIWHNFFMSGIDLRRSPQVYNLSKVILFLSRFKTCHQTRFFQSSWWYWFIKTFQQFHWYNAAEQSRKHVL